MNNKIVKFKVSRGSVGLLVLCLLLGVMASPAAAVTLYDGGGKLYDISTNGYLINGTSDAYDGMYRLRIDNSEFNETIESTSSDGREVTTFFSSFSSGIDVYRRVYVSPTNNFARYIEVLTNPTSVPITVRVDVYGNLGSDSGTSTLVDGGGYLITDDSTTGSSGYDPVVWTYHTPSSAATAATHSLSGDNLTITYNLTVPASSTRRIVYYVGQADSLPAAQTMISLIDQNGPELFENFPIVEQADSVNFNSGVSLPSSGATGQSVFAQVTPIQVGSSVNASLDDTDGSSVTRTSNKGDVYSVTLASGQEVTIDMSSSFDTYLYLYDATGNLLSNNDDGGAGYNSQIVYTASQTGDVFIEATSFSSTARGAYFLEVRGLAVPLPPLAQIQAPNDASNTNGNLFAGTSYTFTDLSRDSDGTITDRCWNFGDGSGINCQQATTVTHIFSLPGSYQVGLTVTDDSNLSGSTTQAVSVETASSTGTQLITVPNSISGELTADDERSTSRTSSFADRFTVQLNQGDEITIDLQASFDTYLFMYDMFDNQIRLNDDGGAGLNSRIVYQASSAQTVIIEATSFGTNALGAYTLDITTSAAVTTQLNIDAWPNPLDNNSYTFMARFPAISGFVMPASYSWDFGNGTNSVAGQTASSTFVPGSSYTVTLTTYDSAMQQLYTGSTTITPGAGSGIAASFSSSATSGTAPFSVTFVDTSSGAGTTGLNYVWDFGDGSSSTESNPSHTYQSAGVYQVLLQVSDSATYQSSSSGETITVLSGSGGATVPVTGTVRLRPQVLMAGFDPMLIDLADSSFTAFAVVRPGAVDLQYVTLDTNQGGFSVAMNHTGTWQNGDQYYEMTYTFPRGSFSSMEMPNLFGDQAGEFNFTAVDIAQQTHSFPNLEFGNHVSLSTAVTSPYVASSTTPGARKLLPQVLGVGFDPILSDLTDTSFDVFALVREGVVALSTVSLTQNQGSFQMAMTYDRDTDNGDKIYRLSLTYARGSMTSVTMGALFGDQPGEFNVMATDNATQTHSFPVVSFGNYPDI